MGLRSILFAALVAVALVGAFYHPIIGLIGYMGHYCIGPERQWWHAPMRGLGLRYSLMFALVSAVSIYINRHKLKYKNFMVGQEWLIVIFVLVVWVAHVFSSASVGRYEAADHPTVKMVKITIFLMMLSHVVTDRKLLKIVTWSLVIFAMILGIQAYEVPLRAFIQGRLESVGGADFSDANRFGGFMAAMLFIIGCQFLNSKNWRQRLLVFLAGGFSANAVILTRSRGALLAVAAGMLAAMMFASPRQRKIIVVGILGAALGLYYLTDDTFRERSTTITAQADERDASASSRLEIWEGGLKMMKANPILGVGPGNFYQYIGRYQPLHEGRDAHNTLVRCGGELGLVGLGVFLAIVLNAFRLLWTHIRKASQFSPAVAKDFQFMGLGYMAALAAMLAYGMTGTLVYTEYLWWMLIMPVCLQRAFENEPEAVTTEGPKKSAIEQAIAEKILKV
ncbi:O-antigen ligase family protein [Geoalkalibacter sp.]|uniref:O-antigen ligase family protein n=1 Tax=Geoalkalibacter sp. TaxID=3041440 RepID=UPI00272EBD6D|nr:O-antigen ligase family protein [Geoalkalibacter sp.]